MISMIRDVMVGLFEHLEIAFVMDVDVRIKYMERIL